MSKWNKEKGRGMAVLCGALILLFLAADVITNRPWVDLKQVINMGNDFQFNLISTSSTIGGFLFTGVSIFIATIDNESIKRMWNHNYLDNIYRVAFLGVVLNVLTIVAALAMIIMVIEESIKLWIVRVEIDLLLVSLVFFIWNVFDLIFVLSRTKNYKNDQ